MKNGAAILMTAYIVGAIASGVHAFQSEPCDRRIERLRVADQIVIAGFSGVLWPLVAVSRIAVATYTPSYLYRDVLCRR